MAIICHYINIIFYPLPVYNANGIIFVALKIYYAYFERSEDGFIGGCLAHSIIHWLLFP